MLYVQQSLLPDEKIVFGGYFHWMYDVSAAFWIAVGIIVAIIVMVVGINIEFSDLPASHYWEAIGEVNPVMRLFAFGAFLFGLFKFALMMAYKATTEIAITNRRLIYKRGIIARHVDEMSVDRIEGIIVEQTIPGRILGYGRVIIRGMGVGAVILPSMINHPVDLRRAIEQAREV